MPEARENAVSIKFSIKRLQPMGIDDNHEETKKWVDAWQKAAVALNDVKKNELCDPDYYEKNRKILDGMLQYACENAKIRLSSGLVEQQRLFMKMKAVDQH